LLERMQFARSELAMQRWLLIQKVLYADNDLLHVNRTFPHIAATVTTPAVTNLSTYQQEGQLVHREL
jgi:hypothetical protein